jgi:hypothetical protein
MRTALPTALSVALLLGAATAADPVTPVELDLKAAKFKPAGGAGDDLLGHNADEGKLFFYANGAAEWTVKVPADGDYAVVVKASGDAAKGVRAKFQVTVDDRLAGGEVTLKSDDAEEYTVKTTLKAGEHKLAVAFTNDEYKENEFDRNLYVYAVTLKPQKGAK